MFPTSKKLLNDPTVQDNAVTQAHDDTLSHRRTSDSLRVIGEHVLSLELELLLIVFFQVTKESLAIFSPPSFAAGSAVHPVCVSRVLMSQQ
jgi:hypothetical protein